MCYKNTKDVGLSMGEGASISGVRLTGLSCDAVRNR